ncbi:MAG: 50S ribosomal protein L10 [Gemmatimonadales bacterium]
MSKTERQGSVDALTKALHASPNVYLTDFTGLTVLRMTELRRRLRAAGARYVVVKNTLAQRAIAANQLPAMPEHFHGPVGLVLAGQDALAAAKVVGEFAKEFEKPTVKAGLIDGKPVAAEYVKRLGEIPPRETLLAMFAGSLNGILYQMVGALEALREQRSTTTAS